MEVLRHVQLRAKVHIIVGPDRRDAALKNAPSFRELRRIEDEDVDMYSAGPEVGPEAVNGLGIGNVARRADELDVVAVRKLRAERGRRLGGGGGPAAGDDDARGSRLTKGEGGGITDAAVAAGDEHGATGL